MTLHHQFRHAAYLTALSLLLAPAIRPQDSTESKSEQIGTTPAPAYQNSTDGLRQLLHEMIQAAKNGDRATLQAQIKDTEIPNYKIWFTTTFNQGRGESWAGPYGESLGRHENEFEDLMLELAQQEGEVSVQKLDAAKIYDPLTVPLDLYLADWKKTDAPKGQDVNHIGYFWFLDGKFRWDSTTEFVRVQPKRLTDFTPPKIVKQTAPVYPPEAKAQGVQGAVKLQVTIEIDGTVTVLGVVSGDPLLSSAATSAVRQWRYEPSRIKGQPATTNTTIEVNFVLNRQP
jgi:TonB family protein